MTTPVASHTGGSKLLTGVLWIAVAAVIVSLVAVIALWPETPPDTTPPTPPSGLSLGETTCKSTSLSWSAASDDRGVTQYDIYKDGQLIQTVAANTRTVSLTVAPGVTWGLYVNARDEAGNVSQASETLRVTPPQCGSDAKAPTTPGDLAAAADGTTVTVTWTASKDDVAVTGYEIFRDGVKTGSVDSPGTKKVTFMDFAVPASKAHTYQVSAHDGQGNASPRSASATVTTGATCTMICSITPVAKDTDVIWGLAQLPDGTVLYNRRDSHEVVQLDPRTGQATVIGVVPGAVGTDGEGGLLGLAIASTFAKDHWVYIYYTTATDNRVARIPLRGGQLDFASLESLVVGIPRNKFHNGGRMRFGPDGKLYVATGDAQNGNSAQSMASLGGKILRFNPDGSVPRDNPFGGYVWSYGHRNPQGLAFDSSGHLWEQEFGNSQQDETNKIVKGGNYGWPVCEGDLDAAGEKCGGPYEDPKQVYDVADASCSGIAIVKNVLYIACLRGSRLYRAEIVDGELSEPTQMLIGTYGRLRTVEPAAGGGLWITTSNGGDKDSIPGNTDSQLFRIGLPGGTP